MFWLTVEFRVDVEGDHSVIGVELDPLVRAPEASRLQTLKLRSTIRCRLEHRPHSSSHVVKGISIMFGSVSVVLFCIAAAL